MANQTEKLFTVAGTATDVNGVTKARFANDLVSRIKILVKAGCTNINLVELPSAMNKVDALRYLQTLGNSVNIEAVETKLADKIREKQVKRNLTVDDVLSAIAQRPKIGESADIETAIPV